MIREAHSPEMSTVCWEDKEPVEERMATKTNKTRGFAEE